MVPVKKRLRLLLLCLVLGVSGAARAVSAEEAALRAALVYKILLFVEWPGGLPPGNGNGNSGEFNLCLITADVELARGFVPLDGRSMKGQRLRLRTLTPLALADGCQVVYLDELEAGLAEDRLRQLAGLPLFLFSGDLGRGAHVRIGRNGNRLAFDVDAAALARQGMHLPAQVLQLAREVWR